MRLKDHSKEVQDIISIDDVKLTIKVIAVLRKKASKAVMIEKRHHKHLTLRVLAFKLDQILLELDELL